MDVLQMYMTKIWDTKVASMYRWKILFFKKDTKASKNVKISFGRLGIL